MNERQKYLDQSEIIVKRLLADLYTKESETKKEMVKIKDKFTQKIDDLDSHYNIAVQHRNELRDKYEKLIKAGTGQWDKAKSDFELILKKIEDDREGFIQKADSIMNEIGNKIKDLEKKTVNASTEVKIELDARMNELKNTRAGLQKKLNEIKSDTSDNWFEVKNWFIEKAEAIKEVILR